MGARKQQSAIDADAILIPKIHEIWENRQIAGALLIDVKEAFDHVSQSVLAVMSCLKASQLITNHYYLERKGDAQREWMKLSSQRELRQVEG